MKSKVRIYGLYDPRTWKVRYIGKTVDPYRRFIRHIHEARAYKWKTAKNRWILELLADGMGPAMKILEIPDDDRWEEAEKRWIADTPDLLNYSVGGNGGPHGIQVRPEVVEKRAAKLRGRKMPDAQRKRLSEACKGRTPWNKGRPRSEETKKKIAETKRLRWQDPEYREKVSRRMKKAFEKRSANPEWRRRNSESHKGNSPSDETREKLRQAGMGRIFSEESRRKMSEAARQRWAEGGAEAFGLQHRIRGPSCGSR